MSHADLSLACLMWKNTTALTVVCGYNDVQLECQTSAQRPNYTTSSITVLLA